MTDKVIVTNVSALRAKYGRGLASIRAAIRRLIASDRTRGIQTRLVAIDSETAMKRLGAPRVVDGGDPEQNKKAIDGVYRALQPDYLMLLGAVDVIPHQDLKNPVYEADDDPDRCAYGDLPYACDGPYSREPHEFLGATRVVGRLPDLAGASEPDYLIALLRTAARWHERDETDYLPYLAFSAQIWERSTRQSLRKAFGTADEVQLVPPNDSRWTAAQLKRLSHFINCHGADADFHFYGEERRTGRQPPSHVSTWIDGKIAEGTIVAAECCYGSQLYDPELAGHQGICSTYLAGGAYALIGATTIAYGEATRNSDADLICQYFFRRVLAGASVGRAFLEARQEFAQSAPELDPVDLKTLAQFTLLGDPSIHPVATPAPFALRQPKRRAAAASAARVERQARRKQLMLKGDTIGRTQAAAVRQSAVRTAGRVRSDLMKLARAAKIAQPKLLTFTVRRPQVLAMRRGKRTGVAARARTSFHVVIGTRRMRAETHVRPVVAIVAKVVNGRVVSAREVHRH
jgi:peptidase C25-like protein